EATVGRLEDAAARRDRVARVRLAGAEVDHVRIARRDREVAERGDAVVVEDGAEGDAVVRRLPDAAGRGRDVEGLRRRRQAFDVRDAAGHVRRTDVAPAQTVDRGLVDGLCAGHAAHAGREGQAGARGQEPVQSHVGGGAGGENRLRATILY